MNKLGLVVSILFIVDIAYLLVKKCNSQAVLPFVSIATIIITSLLNFIIPVASTRSCYSKIIAISVGLFFTPVFHYFI